MFADNCSSIIFFFFSTSLEANVFERKELLNKDINANIGCLFRF